MSIASAATQDFLNTQAQTRSPQQAQTQAPATSSTSIDFDSDEPLACPMRTPGEYSICEACQ